MKQNNGNIMKRLLVITAVLCLAVSCVKPYEKHYPSIAVDRTYLLVTKDAQEVPVMVYYDGNWNVSLPEDTDWAKLDRTSGSGVDGFHVILEENMLEKRTLEITLTGGEDSIVITLDQSRGY